VFTVEDSKRLALEYYKNNLIHFLLSAAFVSSSILAQQTFRFSRAQLMEDVAFMKDFFKFEFVYDNEIDNEELVDKVLGPFEKLGWLHRVNTGDQPYILAHQGLKAAHSFQGLLQNYFEGYWLVLRAFRYLQKKPYSEKDFVKKVSHLGQKALKLELIERPEAISNIMFVNAIKYYYEKNVIEKSREDEKGKERDQEFYTDAGNRLLIQHYSKQISRFLRSPHFVLQ
jgi:glycerol-3-phosphate O-acyltransferase